MENNEKKLEWTKRMNNETVKIEMEDINIEQQNVVRKLKEALDFFENVKIKNMESLDIVKKPLDDLLSSLKYIPVEEGPGFIDLPPEIKTEILNYNCDSGIFVAASVCREWKIILETRLDDLDHVSLGKCCYTDDGYYPHEEFGFCFMPEEKLKASAVLELDIPLEVCHPLTNIDSGLIVEGLMSISDFKIINNCDCREDDQGRRTDDGPMLTKSQTKQLFDALENKSEINSVQIRGLDMTHLDQHKLINSLFKIKELTLAGCREDWHELWCEPAILDVGLFVERLLQAPINSTNFKLCSLSLEYIQYPENLALDLANALCNVKTVSIGSDLPLRPATLKQMIQNILTGGIRMKSLTILRLIDWPSHITNEDLRMLVNNMKRLYLRGNFSQEQVDAVKSLGGVVASKRMIFKR